MLRLNLFHIICILFIFIIENNTKTYKNDIVHQKDLMRDSFPYVNAKSKEYTWFVYMLTCVPIYLLLNNKHPEISHIIEHIVSLIITSVIYKKIINIFTPTNTSIIDYKTIVHVTTSLICVQYNIVNRSSIYNLYMLMALHYFTNLHMYEYNTTKSIFDDVILSHLCFYIFR
jgi:hypothetical protein